MKRLKLLWLPLIAILVLAACGAPDAGTTAAPNDASAAPASQVAAASDGGATDDLQVDQSKLSQTLNIYNWADYLDPAVLEAFGEEYGVQVTMDVFDNNEDMIAKIRPGNSGYDVVFPSDYAVDIMIKDGLAAQIDKSLLPNMKHLKPANMDLYYDKGNVYSLPYNLGTTGLGYNTSRFPTPPNSWAAVFDPQQLEGYSGEVSMLDDEREVPGAALKYLGKSLNSTDPADLEQAEALLKAQKPYLAAYDSSNVSRKLASGEIAIGHIYNYAVLQARLGLEGDYEGNPDIAYFMPKEGGTIWQDNLVIVADSPNQYTAHVFINYMLRPDVAAKNAEYILGITPNADAEALLSPELQQAYKEGFAPDDEQLKRLEWIERNDATVAFTDLWTAVKGE
jgi:spermidine/putrescine transport system substrate-binding protein